VKTYEDLASSAVKSIKVDEKSIYIVYNSNTDKEYEFICDNTAEFDVKLSETISKEESLGKFIHNQVKSGSIQPSVTQPSK
jgi:cellulose synthase/poly-beta-1,6-N-acetylglucosamine synthase-like glycosyltransferase|tara:strand:+ start:524 stop:766 length:243 start_codon:yes stop_codon:yes gene_type:complete